MTKQYKKQNGDYIQHITNKSDFLGNLIKYPRIKDFIPLVELAKELVNDFDRNDTYNIENYGIKTSHGYKEFNVDINYGASKVCITLDRTITFKATYDSYYHGDQTRQEADAYEKFIVNGNKRIIDNIIPILWYFEKEGITIVPTVDVTGEQLEDGWDDDEMDLIEELSSMLEYEGLNDLHDGNFGVIGGKMVCIDYGL